MTGSASPLDALALASTKLHPDDIVGVAAEIAEGLGASSLRVYLADIEQRVLVALQGDGDVVAIDGTVAGSAYRDEVPMEVDDPDGGGPLLWFPLLDSAERIGVVGIRFRSTPDVDAVLAYTNLLGEIIANKTAYGDGITQTRRVRPVTVAAEMRWAMLPPLSFTGRNLTISGILEPAYEIAGDAFDYAVNGSTAHLAIFDAVGHDLQAARVANLAVVAHRHARRRGLDHVASYLEMDEVVASEFHDDTFVTAQLARLDLETGELSWLNAGHPPPMVIRNGHRVDLDGEASLPIGLAAALDRTEVTLAELTLEPGDHVLFFSDGVVEARSADGEEFGRDRLAALVEEAIAAAAPLAETMRVLAHAVVDHQPAQLVDDATLVVLAWHGPT